MSAQHQLPSHAFGNIRERLNKIDTPVALRLNVANHVAHLEQLATRLKSFGMDDALIGRNITDLFEDYETQLSYAIAASAPCLK